MKSRRGGGEGVVSERDGGWCILVSTLFVCLFVSSITSHEPLDRFASNFDRELGRTTKMC